MDDAKLYVGELVHHDLSKWKRCAVVTDHDWLRHAIGMFRFMMPGEVECFEPCRRCEAAIAWAAGLTAVRARRFSAPGARSPPSVAC